MATAVKTVDASIQRLVDIAESIGWSVRFRARSVVIAPPQGNAGTQFSLPTSGIPDARHFDAKARKAGLFEAKEAHDKRVQRETLERAEQEYGAELDGAQVPAQRDQEPAVAAQEFDCPECGRNDIQSAAGLGAHRRAAHGVVGKQSVKSRRKSEQAPQVPDQVAAALQLLQEAVVGSLQELPELYERVERQSSQIHTLAEQAEGRLSKARGEALGTENADLKRQIKELTRFKRRVETLLLEGRTPIMTLAKIVEAGGPGFATPK